MGNNKSTTGTTLKDTNSTEKGFLMENLLRADDEKSISPALLDSFYQLLLIRLSTMNMAIAYELALRIASSSILELASFRKVNSNEILEKKFKSAVGFIKNRYSNYYPFYDSSVLSSLLTADSRNTSSNTSSGGGNNIDGSIINNSPALPDTGNETIAHENSGHKIILPMVDLRNQHTSSIFNNNHNQLNPSESTHGHHLHGLHSISRSDGGHNLLGPLGHLNLYPTDEHGQIISHHQHHRSNPHFIPHNHISLHRPNSSPESPNLTESTGHFRNYNRINSVSSSNLSSSSPSPPT